MNYVAHGTPSPLGVTRPDPVDEPLSNFVAVHERGDGWAYVSFDVAGLSDRQIAEVITAFRMVNVDGDEPDGLGGVMRDFVRVRVVDRLTDILHSICDPQRGPRVLSPV
jgi:hypothetical protein